MAHRSTTLLMLALALAWTTGCSQYRTTGGGEPQVYLEEQAQAAIITFKERDPTLQRFFDTAYGYAVFPEVAKGAVGIGGARGQGVVYEQGRVAGYSTLTQATIGVQLGGQTYREIIFFEDEPTLEVFKQGNMEFSAQASAVAAEEGAAAAADFSNGVAVFTAPIGGLMFEASIGGQQFTYQPRTDEVDGVDEVDSAVEVEFDDEL